MSRPYLSLIAAACTLGALLSLSGCTITSEGVQSFEVPLEEILPPSRIVASYRQLNKPESVKNDELESEFGGKDQFDILKKWTKLRSVYSEYGIPDRPAKARITVTEMSSKQNAYGAYTNLRPSDLTDKSYVKIGVHGTVMDDRMLFVQDRFLIMVRDLSNSEGPGRRTMLINFGHATSERIPRDITDIALVGYLPYENRVPATERLDKEDPLGMGLFKGGGVTARFRIDKRECNVFLADTKDKGSAKSVFKDVKKALEKESPTEPFAVGEEGIVGKFKGSLAMVSKRESTVFGCYGEFDEKEMKSLMSNIDRRIKPYVPVKPKDPAKDDESLKKKIMGR